jgi:hypothetical protein
MIATHIDDWLLVAENQKKVTDIATSVESKPKPQHRSQLDSTGQRQVQKLQSVIRRNTSRL